MSEHDTYLAKVAPGFDFRGEDEVYDILVEHGLVAATALAFAMRKRKRENNNTDIQVGQGRAQGGIERAGIPATPTSVGDLSTPTSIQMGSTRSE